MSDTSPFSQTLRLADLRGDAPVPVLVEPGPADRRAIADDLGIPSIRKLRLAGTLSPIAKSNWRLDAVLGATVVQDCVVTLAPVTTRIDEAIVRTYLADVPEPQEGEEVEMPENDTVEPLPAVLDLGAVMTEALALALPAYPHAEGVAPVDASFAGPGIAPMTEEEAKPFAGLAALRNRLDRKDD